MFYADLEDMKYCTCQLNVDRFRLLSIIEKYNTNKLQSKLEKMFLRFSPKQE